MPELPEVETVVRGLRPHLAGQKIAQAQVFSTKIRIPIPKTLVSDLVGARILDVERRAKYIYVHLDRDITMVIHLGMTGSVILTKNKADKTATAFAAKRHDHLWVRFEDGTEIVFSDPRRFGVLTSMATKTLIEWPPIASLGPEPLDKKFTGEVLHARLKGRKTPIKVALMNQEIVVGVGNIYASEALFKAGISPLREAGTLSIAKVSLLVEAIKTVLKASIRAGGSSLRDYRQASGEVGFFQDKFSVYDREGLACPGCTCHVERTGGIKRLVQGGRATFFCPRKQK
jgi:formamidopyrimidine-DNA glycosylase